MLTRMRTVVPLCLLAGLLASAALAQTPPPEGVRVRQLGPIQPHWVFLVSPAGLDSELSTKVEVIDGDALQLLGLITGGVLSTAALSPDRKFIYVADTFYSRGARGERTDVLSTYDARQLAPVREVVIPPKRQQHIPPDSSALAVTPDGRFVLVANLTPASSVTVVDVSTNKVAGELDTSGCVGIMPAGARRFNSICGDGALLSVHFDDHGKPAGVKRMSKPFFDPEKDPVFSVPAVIGANAYYVSYHGVVYPVSWSADPPAAGTSWPLLSDADRKEGWRPGGYQPLASHASNKLLYVLMHRGGEWTHKQPGTEVWVFDAQRKRRVDRIVLPRPGLAIYVTRDRDPRLYVMALPQVGGVPGAPMLQSFSTLTGRYLGAIDQLPGFPIYIFGP